MCIWVGGCWALTGWLGEQNICSFNDFYRPQTKFWGKVISLQASVCPQGEVPDQVHPPEQTPSPGTRHPHPGPGAPPGSRHPPGTRYTPREQTAWDQVHPPGADTPPGPGAPPGSRHPPGSRPPGTRYTPLEQTPPELTPPPGPGTPSWSRHPPGPGTPPGTSYPPKHAGRHGQCTGGPHPTGMQSCFS